MKRLLVRADASLQSGTGHVMRCLALAQAWQSAGGQVTFLSRCESARLRRRVRDGGARLVSLASAHPDPRDWQATYRLIRRLRPDWLVLDGYHFDPDYQQAARAAGVRVMVIDDLVHWPRYHADILLNQNLGAEKLRYRCDPDTKLLLGTKYVLLRREFLQWQGWRREIPQDARRVLVTMGGSDPGNITLAVIRALRRMPVKGLEAVVLVGAGNPRRAELAAAVGRDTGGPAIRLEFGARNVAGLMAWADVAVSAGGSTCWELACMGLPNLAVAIADNQLAVVRALDAAGVAKRTLPHRLDADLLALLCSAAVRRAMSERGRQLVAGNGCGRVAACLRAAELTLRRAEPDDSRMLWRWRNERATRNASFDSAPVPWPDHALWFARRLRSQRCLLYIAEDARGAPVGQARFAVLGRRAVISVGLDKRLRGQGLGAALILRGSERCFADAGVEHIRADVKPENGRSLQAFRDAGYTLAGTVRVHGQPARRLALRREELV